MKSFKRSVFFAAWMIVSCAAFFVPRSFADGCDGGAPPPEIKVPQCNKDASLDDSKWVQDEQDSFITFFGDDKFWIIPGQRLVYKSPASQAPEISRLISGVSAHGSSATIVVQTQNGKAILVDAGSGATRAVHQYQLQQLMARMGVTRVTHVHISHAHDDHFKELRRVVETHRVPASRVIAPPLELPFCQGLVKEWNGLARDFPALGYQPINQTPTTPSTPAPPRVYRPSTNGKYLTARFEQGGLTITYITHPQAIAEINAAGGSPSNRNELIDSSSAMMKIQKAGDPNAKVILGDLRGEDYLRIKDAMEAESRGSWAEFFSNVNVIHGFHHHMGVVRNATDVKGIKALLEVTVFARGNLSVLVQSDTKADVCKGQMRPKLAEALAWQGVNVTVTLKGDTTTPSNATVDSTGAVSSQGPAVRQFNLPAADQARVEAMLRARTEFGTMQRTWNLNRSAMVGIFGVDATNAENLMNQTNTRMRQLLQENIDKTLGRLLEGSAGSREINDRATFSEAELRQNLETIASQGAAFRQHLVEKEIAEFADMLVRAGPLQYELERELKESLKGARGNSARLLKLLETIDPQIQRELLRTRASGGAIRQQLRNAMIQGRIFSEGGGGGRVRSGVAAGILIAAEVTQMATDFYKLYAEAGRNDVSKQFAVLTWWLERAAAPNYAGWIDKINTLGDPDKRVGSYAGIENFYRQNKIDGIALTMPETEEAWSGFYLWALANIRSYDDYADHFVHMPVEAIRYSAVNPPDFPNGDWKYRKMSWDLTAWTTAGARQEEWVSSPMLNKIMKDVMPRAIDRTEKTIAATWARREKVRPRPTGPTIGPSNTDVDSEAMRTSAGAHIGNMKPTARAHFKEGADRTMYSHFKGSHVTLRSSEWGSNPYLLVFENDGAPDGYVLVSGADYNTYANIRASKTYQFNHRFDIHISPRERDEHIGYKPRPADQEAALELVKRDPNAEFFSEDDRGGGKVRIWFYGPNHWALGLVRRDSLNLEEIPPLSDEEKRLKENRPDVETGRDLSLPFIAPEPAACPEKEPDQGSFDGDCGKINCDCNHVDAGLLTREFREECRTREDELKLHCELTGELLGPCHETAHGPNAWPK